MGAMASSEYWAKRSEALAQGRRLMGECPGLQPWHVRRLYAFFRRADKDGSDWISVLEFLMFFDVERTVFAVKAFTAMDADGDHQIDFPEFARRRRPSVRSPFRARAGRAGRNRGAPGRSGRRGATCP